VNSKLIPDPVKLELKTIVDGEVRQQEMVSDLLFGCPYLISYLSQGTTLQKGSVIMTGTPGGEFLNLHLSDLSVTDSSYLGVGAGMNPPRYLVPGTKMEVQISEIGTLKNGVKFV
jgi:2-keto-4-pentenoate hydratase/2-oxohepta-3-ene-1,7-dioic acid hydratase in catechol pathway